MVFVVIRFCSNLFAYWEEGRFQLKFLKKCIHTLSLQGMESFISSVVRPALIPLMVNHSQDLKMWVSWHGWWSIPRSINGVGPAGASLGISEYFAQSNNNIPENNLYIPPENLKSQHFFKKNSFVDTTSKNTNQW